MCLRRETDLILGEHAFSFLLKGCVSFKISNQCDTSVFITHTKKKRMFVFQQVVIFLVLACSRMWYMLNCMWKQGRIFSFNNLYRESVALHCRNERKYGDRASDLKRSKINLK